VRDGTPRRDAATGDPVWALTLLGGPAYSEPAAGPERAARVDAYRGWAEQLARRGALVLAEELASPVAVLPIRPPDDPALASPNDAGRGFALGLFLVHAPDADEAASLAEGSPHLGFGGRVAVQPVVAH
jgi:hypothetical protein